MAKDLTPKQKLIRREARKSAETAGKIWKDISKEERKVFLKQARVSASSRKPDASRQNAKKAAAREGLVWNDLSKDQRKKYLEQARRRGAR